jgi:hypothetical protein
MGTELYHGEVYTNVHGMETSEITKLLSYQYAIYYYYFAVENDHWEKHSNKRMA